MFLAIIIDMLRKNEEQEYCKKLKKEIKKFETPSKTLLDNYNFYCKNNF